MALLSSIRRAFQDSLDVYLLEAVKTKDLTKIHQIVMDQVPDIPPNAMNPARLMYLALANKKFDLAQEIYTTFVGYAIDDYVEYNDEGECVGWTALHFAVDNKNRKAVKFLLKRGADVNCKNEEKDQPINLAVDNKDIKITRLLLSYGADKRHCQNWLVTPDNKSDIIEFPKSNIESCDSNMEFSESNIECSEVYTDFSEWNIINTPIHHLIT
ncbi:putative ankyrin repeat protein RF_0381 isoform X1 [Microplitis mediator]|uniref:putative ankyrin repeat protein RF_0381 isoform X1 n=1 Tax=Microplitis mediator TaxID=375433 RepID=UPI0025548F72|nr:putative ankyrin repeat protein RF_0381 isoform X1 [Microplitis mediator]